MAAFCVVYTHAGLTPGAIAITAFNMDNPDELAFIALENIAEGEELYFTDNGWQSNDTFRTGEGVMIYTVPTGGLAAGTIVTQTVSGMALSSSGDQILVYQGDTNAPQFIYAINSEGTGWQTNATSANRSALPAGLTNGYTALALPEVDNACFDFSVITSGNKAEWSAAIGAPSNWIGDDTMRMPLPSGSFPVNTDSNQPPSITLTPNASTFSAAVETTLSIEVTARHTDVDESTITAQAISLPDGASFTTQSGSGPVSSTFTWTPSATQTGIYSMAFTASDKDGTTTNAISIHVYSGSIIAFTTDQIFTEESDDTKTLSVMLYGTESASADIVLSGTATQNTDYRLSTDHIQFLGSDTAALAITILSDDLPEGPESIILTITNAIGADIGVQNTLRIILRDNDSFSVVSANLGSQTSPADTCYEPFCGRIFEGILPDIAAVQEFNVTNRGVYAGYRDFVDQHFGTGFYYYVENEEFYSKMPNGIISRWPILDAGEWADDDLNNRDFAWATIQLPCDRLLHVISVHLKAGDGTNDIARRIVEAQLLSSNVITAFSTTNYIALCGDFNLTGRDEETLLILTNQFPYTQTPKDQYGYKNTNKTREYPYDWVMPNELLDQHSVTAYIDGVAFPEGAVFDSRLWETPPSPVQTTDSGGEGLQHMPVLRQFSFISSTHTAQSNILVQYTFDAEESGTNTAVNTDSNLTASVFTSSDNSTAYLQGSPASGYAIRDSGWDTFENYFAFTITIANGYQAFLDALSFDGLRGSTGPTGWNICSSTDDYSDTIATGTYPMEDAWATTIVALGLDLITGEITFRIYGCDAEASTGNWRIDNVTLTGTINEIDPNDQDADGLPDAWETTYFGSLHIANATSDNDGDGASDRHEYVAGTSPVDAQSIFTIAQAVNTKQQITLSWSSASNRTYAIYIATNLNNAYTLHTDNIAATPPRNTQTISKPNGPTIFFKLDVTY